MRYDTVFVSGYVKYLINRQIFKIYVLIVVNFRSVRQESNNIYISL